MARMEFGQQFRLSAKKGVKPNEIYLHTDPV